MAELSWRKVILGHLSVKVYVKVLRRREKLLRQCGEGRIMLCRWGWILLGQCDVIIGGANNHASFNDDIRIKLD
jgi:hypothetical protein